MKFGFVTIIGKPNSGKSSLINAILKEHVSITSKKAQTTRKNAKGIYNDNECQIVFVDTPGIHQTKDFLDKYMEKSIDVALNDVDIVIVIFDVMDYVSKEQFINFFDFIKKINKHNEKVIVCINKIDLVEQSRLEYIEKELKEEFDDACFVSCLKKKNIDELLLIVKSKLKVSEPFFPIDSYTDMTEKEMVGELVREQCLYKLDKEIPHGIVTCVNVMEFKNKKCIVKCDVICEKENHKGIIIGKGGSMLKNIGYASRVSIEKLLGMKVFLELNVKVKENWKDDYMYLKDIGYNIKDL